MDKLKELISRCKASVSVTVNDHRDRYQSVSDYILDLVRMGAIDLDGKDPDISPEVLAKMIELNTVVDIQWYPDTPVGFYRVLHYDLDAAMEIALSSLS